MHKKTDWIHKTLHFLEWLIAIITLVVLVGMLALEIYKMFTSKISQCSNAGLTTRNHSIIKLHTMNERSF